MMGARQASGLAARLKRRLWPRPPGPVILMYHRIAEPETDPWGLAVSPARFDAQLALLKTARTVLPLPEFTRRLQAGGLPPDAVAITFDDGYACNATTAAPLLRAHGLPATVFLMTSKVGDPTEFWSDALERIVTTAAVEALTVESPSGELRVELGPPDPPETRRRWNALEPPRTRRQAAYLALWRALRDFPAEGQAEAVAALHRQSDTPQTARDSHRAVTAAEAEALARDPLIEVGAHSVTHARLSALSPEAQFHEIRASREACADLVGTPPASFAYPYGDYAPETVSLVARAGFEVACTTRGGAVAPASGPLELPRIPVGDWEAARFAAVLRAQTL